MTSTILTQVRSVVLVSLVVALLAAGSAGAVGGSPVAADLEQAAVLASPGVVLIDMWATVDVIVSEQTYEFEYSIATGSGFVVTPEGDVVTASHVVDLTKDDRQWLKNAVANELMGLQFGEGDDPGAMYELEDPEDNEWLSDCYAERVCEFEITRHVDVYTPVALAGVQAPKGLTANVVVSTGYQNTDVAVLKVNGKNMATVSLADSIDAVESADQVVALGFAGSSLDNGGLTEPTKLFGHVSAVRDIDASQVVEIDVDVEGGMSGGPALDASGLVIGVTSATGVEGSQRTQGYVRSIDDVRAALAKAGVEASRGLADEAFTRAMKLYWAHHYSAAIPHYQKVLNLADGHLLAIHYLAESEKLKGTPADVPLQRQEAEPVGEDPPFMLMAGAGGALVAMTVAGVMVLRRRKHGQGAAAPVALVLRDADPPNTGAPASASEQSPVVTLANEELRDAS